jgi:hypothetical protein
MTCSRFLAAVLVRWPDQEPAAQGYAVEPDLNAAVVLPEGGANLLDDLRLMSVFRDGSEMIWMGCVPCMDGLTYDSEDVHRFVFVDHAGSCCIR